MVRTASTDASSTELEIQRFTDAELMAIESIEDATKLLSAEGILPVAAHEVLGNGFEVLDTKDKITLIGVPMLLLEWRFNDGDNGEFVSISAITSDNRKIVINDGSTGIRDQLKFYTEQTGRTRGLVVRKGLRVSEYDYTDDQGVTKSAKTFYLNTSA